MVYFHSKYEFKILCRSDWAKKSLKKTKTKGGNQKPIIERKTIQEPNEKGQTTIYKTPHRNQKIEQPEPHQKCANRRVTLVFVNILLLSMHIAIQM